MLKAHRGLKRVCQHCSARFYDLCKTPIICPKCHHTFDPDLLLKHRRPRASAALKETAEVPIFDALVEEMSFTVGPEDLEDGDEVLIEDTSDLGGDDDMKEVIDHRTEEDRL